MTCNIKTIKMSAEQTACIANTKIRTYFFAKKLKSFQKEIKLYEIKKLREANTSLNETREASSKPFDNSFKNFEIEHKNFIKKSVKAKVQIIQGVGLIDHFG